MEPGICLSEKRGGVSSDGNRDFSKIDFKEFNRSDHTVDLAVMFYDAFLKVTQEDLSEWVNIPALEGIEIPMQKAEARIYWYLHNGFKINLAFEDKTLVGFLVYQPIFEGMIAIRMMYLIEKFRGKNIAFDMINDIKPRPLKVLFQTHRDIEPKECLKVTEVQRQCVMADNKMITWQMDWGD